MYDRDADGSLLWANTHFWEMMGVGPAKREASLFDWTDYIIAEDQPVANKELTRAVIDIVQISDSLRLKRKWQPPNAPSDRYAHDEPFRILSSASPHIEADGTVDHTIRSRSTNYKGDQRRDGHSPTKAVPGTRIDRKDSRIASIAETERT
ncbi:hypothetical protein PV10_07933 [Exophiala mesophila]|uniref:PAS domain-containing protein n=1 Tax=Exophiala mesophila TaxID=212818 RepID=A0A0D1Z762_EXOME|nr:uncharacterized protein PV10_07933 [Exophiala mesophila]KIV90652.1 hypothetical protein PV10_07933 [Exophiala mesophila]